MPRITPADREKLTTLLREEIPDTQWWHSGPHSLWIQGGHLGSEGLLVFIYNNRHVVVSPGVYARAGDPRRSFLVGTDYTGRGWMERLVADVNTAILKTKGQ